MISREQIEIIKKELSAYNISKLGVFGAYARDSETTESDLDILISFEDDLSLFDLIELEIHLSQMLGVKVDLVTEKSVSPHIKKYIDADLKLI